MRVGVVEGSRDGRREALLLAGVFERSRKE